MTDRHRPAPAARSKRVLLAATATAVMALAGSFGRPADVELAQALPEPRPREIVVELRGTPLPPRAGVAPVAVAPSSTAAAPPAAPAVLPAAPAPAPPPPAPAPAPRPVVETRGS